MKLRYFAIVALTVAINLGSTHLALADQQSLSPGANITAAGTSGGESNSGDCGFVAATPNHIIDIAEDLPYVVIKVQTSGAPTLLIEGPAGRYCVLPEGGGGNLQFSGYAPSGTYNIYVGDREQGQHSYNLSILGRAN
ncbi:hypothetical protein M595_3936 [Lyngbya aestuarii BL J]|uniref:Uncharacterized protein n=1 Tax=Lyngbya aestuarii BL J TaxID=1348334 RepID=U7QFR8_9CYAN|nr:hypothetical protein [Lyngbya aestuarii]ERT06122.1 hypothetical protein M595_3936 [Lyngbya aestuarii BL J]